jgi:hypothetical protein
LSPSTGDEWRAEEDFQRQFQPLPEKNLEVEYLPSMTLGEGDQLGTTVNIGGSRKHTEG